MEDTEILARVHALVDEEHGLRERMGRGEIGGAEERERLEHLEQQLDQCWDLLRRRRAAREVGRDPDDTRARPVAEVEHYQQ